jgi:hypothetical protein
MAKTAKKNESGQTLNLTLRPRHFTEVLGLDAEVAAIQRLIEGGTVPRAFLLAGPFGCGKTTLAHLIGHAVQGAEALPEDLMWIREINAASITGIDAMRELIDSSRLAPFNARYNVIILDEAHKLSKAAQEALLKELESESSPTIWIICTTDKEKLAEGIRAGRCLTLTVRGLESAGVQALVERAARASGHDGDVSEFVIALNKAKVTSPRKILMAFDAYHAGIPAREAVGGMALETLPEYWEICLGVLFGSWQQKYSLGWIKDKQFPAVCEQLRLLDDRLKKKASTEEGSTELDEEDVQGRPEVAHALRAITAATLKGQLARQATRFDSARAQKAAEALHVLAHCLGQNCFGLEYALVVGALYRVNQIMGKK